MLFGNIRLQTGLCTGKLVILVLLEHFSDDFLLSLLLLLLKFQAVFLCVLSAFLCKTSLATPTALSTDILLCNARLMGGTKYSSSICGWWRGYCEMLKKVSWPACDPFYPSVLGGGSMWVVKLDGNQYLQKLPGARDAYSKYLDGSVKI